MIKVAVLDDWQDVARTYGDWDRLAGKAEVSFFADAFRDEEQTVTALAEFQILLTVQDRMRLPASLLGQLPKLEMIGITQSNATLDLAACAKHGIVVCKTDGPGEDGAWAAAELAFGLLLSAFRWIPEADATMRAGGFQRGVPVGRTLSGKTLGIVGLGRLGSRVALYAKAFGMKVIAWSPGLDDTRAAQAGARRVSKEELFATADAVSIHVKLSDESRGLVGADDLARLKPGAVLVNTSRGPIVDEAALVAAVREERVVAALDVFDDEPLPPDHPLRELPGTVLTPHLGFGVEETWNKFYPQSVGNVLAFLDGKPIHIVDLPTD